MAKFKVKKIAVVANNEVNNEVATIVTKLLIMLFQKFLKSSILKFLKFLKLLILKMILKLILIWKNKILQNTKLFHLTILLSPEKTIGSLVWMLKAFLILVRF